MKDTGNGATQFASQLIVRVPFKCSVYARRSFSTKRIAGGLFGATTALTPHNADSLEAHVFM